MTVAAVVPYGAGKVLVVGAPELAMNQALARADNAQFWLSALSALGPGPYEFDEHHHGFTNERSVVDFARRYGLHFAVAQLLLGLCLWAVALKRFGRPRAPPESARVGATDALFAMSRLYREGRHHGFAASLITRGLTQELALHAGLPAHAPATSVAEGLAARGREDLANGLQGRGPQRRDGVRRGRLETTGHPRRGAAPAHPSFRAAPARARCFHTRGVMTSTFAPTSAAASNAVAAAHAIREGVLSEVRKAVVGQDEPLELMLVRPHRRRPRAAGGRARRGQDADGQGARARRQRGLQAHSVHPGPDARRHPGHQHLRPEDASPSCWCAAPSSRTCCWRTKSTAPPPRRSPRCWRPCRSAACRWRAGNMPLSPLFTVFATQNPVESEGTYPLPEAQLDRFLLKIDVGYPAPEEEDAILASVHRGFDSGDLARAGVGAAVTKEGLLAARAALNEVTVEPPVLAYVRKLVAATRSSSRIRLGAGPRAGVHLLLASKALAALRGRGFVTPDDVRFLAGPVLKHRLLLSPDAELDGATPSDVLREVVQSVEVPR